MQSVLNYLNYGLTMLFEPAPKRNAKAILNGLSVCITRF